MRNTRSIATHGLPPQGRDPRSDRGRGEQVTGSLERVGAGSPDQDQLIAQVRDVAFPLALRGYDREAVDAYVKRVQRLVTDLAASRSPEAAIRRALDQVGEETSSILQRAQQTANEITERSRASADDRIAEAEREARAVTEDAEDRVRELEADYGAIWARRDRLLDEVRDLAERLLATADDAADRFPTQDEEAEVVESLRPDTESFTQLEPGEDEGGDEETTVSAEYEAGYGRPAGARPISAVPDPGEGSDDGGELSAGDEMDFAAPLGDDEPDLADAPADQGSPPQRDA